MVSRRRIRATFLLRCVILLFCVAVFAGALFAVTVVKWPIGWGLAVLSALVVFWFVGLEGGLLPYLIERAAVRRAEKSGRPVSSPWFVDADQERRDEFERFSRATRDNPTIR